MINYVDKIENKLSHFSEKIIFTCRYWISLNENDYFTFNLHMQGQLHVSI